LSFAIIAIIFLRLAKERKDFSGQTRIINHVMVYVQLYLCHTGEFFERGNAKQERWLPRRKMTEHGKSFAGTVIAFTVQ
jgi:hypothetical protein